VSTGANDGWCLWLYECQLIELAKFSEQSLAEGKVDATLSSRTRLTKRSLALAVASSLLSARRDTVAVFRSLFTACFASQPLLCTGDDLFFFAIIFAWA